MAEIIYREIFENGDLIGYEPGRRLVRCKGCKWWKTNYSWSTGEFKVCAREAYEPLREAEYFCSYGEMKGETKMPTVIKEQPIPIYETTCYECGSVFRYKAAEVSWMHITCPVCGVSNWASLTPINDDTVGERIDNE